MEGSDEQRSSPNSQIPHEQRPQQQELGFQSSTPNRDSNRDLPHAGDNIKQIVAQLQHLSLKEVVNGELQSSASTDDEEIKLEKAIDEEIYDLTVKQAINEANKDESLKQAIESLKEDVNGELQSSASTDDEEIKLEKAIDEEIYDLTVKQAINEALKDESLKQAIDEEIVANQSLSDGLSGQALRRFIDEALESNLEKAETLTVAEVATEAETHDEPKGIPVLEEDVAKEESKIVNLNGENEILNGDGEVTDEVEIDNYESNRREYENQESNGWNEDRDEDGVNNCEEYRSDNGKEEEEGYNGNDDNVGGDYGAAAESKDGRQRMNHYPLRTDAEDCSYYMKTGMCKFGSSCKFNHPLRRKNQVTRETVKQREESSERPGQTECKYYLTSGGCKYGKACKYNHSMGKPAVAPIVEFNFLGLPIRPGERECPYYMRTGSCKYGSNCRFNHPDPTAAGGGGDTPSRYGNGGSVSLQSVPQTTIPSWSSPRPMNETTPFVPVMYPQTQGLPPNPDWNSYQAPPAYRQPSETGLPTPPAFAMNNPATDTSSFYPPHHQRQMRVEEYPERPGEPECTYFLKTGDCKYRSNCKFHHPKTRIPKTPPCILSDKGLPLRPGQNTCTHYSRYGICKFGPACKYDHPVNYSNSTWSEQDEPPPFGNSVTADGLQ